MAYGSILDMWKLPEHPKAFVRCKEDWAANTELMIGSDGKETTTGQTIAEHFNYKNTGGSVATGLMYDTVGNGSFYNFYPPDETNPRGVLCSVQGVALNDAFAIYGKFNGITLCPTFLTHNSAFSLDEPTGFGVVSEIDLYLKTTSEEANHETAR